MPSKKDERRRDIKTKEGRFSSSNRFAYARNSTTCQKGKSEGEGGGCCNPLTSVIKWKQKGSNRTVSRGRRDRRRRKERESDREPRQCPLPERKNEMSPAGHGPAIHLNRPSSFVFISLLLHPFRPSSMATIDPLYLLFEQRFLLIL